MPRVTKRFLWESQRYYPCPFWFLWSPIKYFWFVLKEERFRCRAPRLSFHWSVCKNDVPQLPQSLYFGHSSLLGWFYTSMMMLISLGTLATSVVIYVQKKGVIGQRPTPTAMLWAQRVGKLIGIEMPLLMKQAYALKAKVIFVLVCFDFRSYSANKFTEKWTFGVDGISSAKI